MEKFTSTTEKYLNERELLFDKFVSLGEWLYQSNGLGLMSTIDTIFLEQGWREKISLKEVAKFNYGLELLNKTSIEKNWIRERMQWKLPGGRIENASLVKDESGDWHPVNKLNTNTSDLSDMLVELVIRSLIHNPEKGEIAYNSLIKDTKSTLLSWRPIMKNLLEKYFIKLGNGLTDFKRFTRFSKKFSKIGEANEKSLVNYLKENEFTILYEGGNGDFIDMIFGVDLIIFRSDFGHKTVQVKSKINWDSLKYYKVDWICTKDMIYDKTTRENINIEKETTNIF